MAEFGKVVCRYSNMAQLEWNVECTRCMQRLEDDEFKKYEMKVDARKHTSMQVNEGI